MEPEVLSADGTEPLSPEAVASDTEIGSQSLAEFAEVNPLPNKRPPVEAPPEAKPERHRAKSQIANPDDVKVIGEYTKRIKEAEALAGKDIVQKDGESNRVYEMRRRAELAERRIAAKTEAPAVVAQPIAARPAPVSLPPAKKAAEDPEPDPTTYDDLTKYFRDQAMWAGRETLRQARAEEDTTRRTHEQAVEVARLTSQWVGSVTSAKTKYADFEQIAFGPLHAPGFPQLTEIPQGSLIDAWILERPYGADLLYTLKKTPSEFARLIALPLAEQVEELTLLGQRLKARMPAVTTGAAAATLAQPVSRPPTPVRTGPMRTSDDAPPNPDDLSLDGFAEAYGTVRRRG